MCEKLGALKFIKFTTYNLDLKYFNLSEFDSPDEVESGNKMDSKLKADNDVWI